tara:strand:- start:10254 stop:11675 length:1422 start_codon:yes stop_codon:yes gene_type:complete
MEKNSNILILVLSTLFIYLLSINQNSKAHESELDQSSLIKRLSFSILVKEAAPAVVNIFTKKDHQSSNSPLFSDPFFKKFFEEFIPQQKGNEITNSLGSGVIIDKRGYVVTNNHVIKDAKKITVALSDKREFDAKLVLADPRTDLAILKIEVGSNFLPYIKLMNSDTLEVGDIVLAIGNPFGVGQTVTSGIISALARTRVGIGDYQFFIQTDAAINPGNSGGALITSEGKLAGINTAIFSRTGGSIGIGFAIPSNMVASVIRAAKNKGIIVRPWLGIEGRQLNKALSNKLGVKETQGLIVDRVYPASSSYNAGIKNGDIIISFNGIPIADHSSLSYRVAISNIGEKIKLRVLRNGKLIFIELVMAAAPEVPKRNVTEIKGDNPFSGSLIANLSPALAEELGINSLRYSNGVIIISINRFSRSYHASLRPGDIIKKINGINVTKVSDIKRVLNKYDNWTIIFLRGEREYRLTIR